MSRVRIRPRRDGVPDDLGQPQLPGSKSDTQRLMLLGAFAGGRVQLAGALRSEDTRVLADALAALGAAAGFVAAGAGPDQATYVVTAAAPVPPRPAALHLGENGTALRMLLAVVPLLGGRATFDGAPGLRRRPVDAAVALLRSAGCAPARDVLPLTVDGSRAQWPEPLVVDASGTTQVASGALLGLALRQRRLGLERARLLARQVSALPYLFVTAESLAQFGFGVRSRRLADAHEFQCQDEEEGRDGEAAARLLQVPADPSAAAFPLVLAAMHGRHWTPPPLPGAHPDQAIAGDVVTWRNAAPAAPLAFDLRTRPDSFCALAALAATRTGTTRLAGAPALRHKESDRVQAMAAGLRAAGVRCEELPDGLVVTGPLRAADTVTVLPAPRDHRVVMALSLLGTFGAGVELEHAGAVAKSWPSFFTWLARVADVSPPPSRP